VSEGWQTKRLGDVCTLQRGFDLPKRLRQPGEHPLISSSGEIDSHSEAKVPAPGVATGRSGSIGNVFYIEEDFWPLNTVLYVKDFHGNDERFVYHLLKKFDLKKYASGAGVPTLNRNNVHDVEVCIPTCKEEQKRIVAILDEAFAAIDKAMANAKKNLANARELFESYLESMFDVRDKEWSEYHLGDPSLIEIIDGDRGKNYPKKSDFQSEGFCLFLNTKNVRPDGFNFDSLMFISEEKDEALRKGKLKRRDVIITTRGTIGNIALYDDSVPYNEIRINSGMLIFRPNEERMLSDYLFEILRSSTIKRQITQTVSGAAQPQLPIKTLVKFNIPVPKDLGQQRTIVSKLRHMSAETDVLASIYRKKISASHELRQSLLHQAFAGGM